MITFQCPNCSNGYEVEDLYANQETSCPECHLLITIPPTSGIATFARPMAVETMNHVPLPEQQAGVFVERKNTSFKTSSELKREAPSTGRAGTSTVAPSAPKKALRVTTSLGSPNVSPSQKRSGKSPVLIIFLLLAVIAAGAGYYFFIESEKSKQEVIVTQKEEVKSVVAEKKPQQQEFLKFKKLTEKEHVEIHDKTLLDQTRLTAYVDSLKKLNASFRKEMHDVPPVTWKSNYRFFPTREDVFPLLSTIDYQVLAVAKKYDSGLLVLFANGPLKFANDEYEDALLLNSLKLITDGKDSPLIGVQANESLRRSLTKRFGQYFRFKDIITAYSNLKEYDAVILPEGTKRIDSSDFNYLKDFMQEGKGLLLPANIMAQSLVRDLAKEGLILVPATHDEVELVYTIEPSPNMNVLYALSKVKLNKGKEDTNAVERDIACASLIRSMQAIPSNDKTILPSFDIFAKNLSDKFDEKTQKLPFNLMEKIKIAYLDAQIAAMPVEKQTKHPVADIYPGKVDRKCDDEDVDLRINVYTPYQHSTGFYARPGEVVTVQIPESEIKRGMYVRIGNSVTVLAPEQPWYRAPNIIRTTKLDKVFTKIVNPYGGPVYIMIPDQKGRIYPPPSAMANPEFCRTVATDKQEEVPLTLFNAVKMHSYTIGENIFQDWDGFILDYKAMRSTPMMEIGCPNVILTLSTKEALENVEKPEKTAALWEEIMDECKIFTGRDFDAPFPLRVSTDAIEKASEEPYPIAMPIVTTKQLVDRMEAKRKGSDEVVTAMIYFFLGRAELLPGRSPVMRKLFTAYLIENTTARGRRDIAPELSLDRQDSTIEKILNHPFRWEGADVYGKMTPYMQLIDEFGWACMTDVVAEYANVSDEAWPKTDQELNWDFARRYSHRTQQNLVIFFKIWGWRMPEIADVEKWRIKTKEPTPLQKKKGMKAKYTEQEQLLMMNIWLPDRFPDSYLIIK